MVYKNCLKSCADEEQTENHVKAIYAPFTAGCSDFKEKKHNY